jgi:hypothetical protein
MKTGKSKNPKSTIDSQLTEGPLFPLPIEEARFFNERAGRADMDAFRRILNREGGEQPRSGDEMPE